MLCPNCNSEVSNNYSKCNYCGCDLSSRLENDNSHNQDTSNNESYFSNYYANTQQIKTESRKSKKMVIAIVSIVLFILAAIPLTYYLYNYVYLYNKQVSSVTDKVEAKNFNAAKTSYDKIKNSKPYAVKAKVLSTVEKNLKDRVEVLNKSYIDDKVNYNELEKWFEGLSKIAFLKPLISEKEKSLAKIKDSKDNMTAAEEAFKEKEYLEAISKYKLVIKDDSNNYKKSQNNIKTCIKDMYNYYIDEAEKMSSDSKYEDAYKTVHSIESYYKEDTKLKSIEDGYLKKLLDDTIKKADTLNSKKKFDDAISQLEKISSYFPNNAVITKKVNTYRKNKIDAKVAEQERQEKRKKDIISKLTKGYDSKYGFNIYSPKGYSTKNVNITETINLEPRLYVGADDYAALMLLAGFVRGSHINFNKINFDVDGEIIEWPIDKENKKSQTGYDKVAEWCLLYYIHNTEMLDTVKKISKGKKVTMIFEGKKMHKHALTAKEMEDLKMFVELFGYYNHVGDIDQNEDYGVTEAI